MNSHFQSSDTPWTLSGASSDCSGRPGSSSCEPSQATPPRSMMVINGMDQVTNSIWPDSTKSSRRRALELDDRNHHAKARIATMVGTTIASMMASESIMIVVLPLPTEPSEGKMPGPQPVNASSGTRRPPQRTAKAMATSSLTRGGAGVEAQHHDLGRDDLCRPGDVREAGRHRHLLRTVRRVGDHAAADRAAEILAPQLLAAGGIESIEVAADIAEEHDPARRRSHAAEDRVVGLQAPIPGAGVGVEG